MDLEKFTRLYKAKNCPVNTALCKKVYYTDVSSSTLVWSEEQFLVELYYINPNVIIVPHAHPFESVTLFCGGSMLGMRDGALSSNWLTNEDSGTIGPVLPKNVRHWFETKEEGAVFYVISKWDTISEKNSATVKYIGNPLGPIHENNL